MDETDEMDETDDLRGLLERLELRLRGEIPADERAGAEFALVLSRATEDRPTGPVEEEIETGLGEDGRIALASLLLPVWRRGLGGPLDDVGDVEAELFLTPDAMDRLARWWAAVGPIAHERHAGRASAPR